MCLCVQIGRLLQPVRRVCGYPARCLVLVRRRASRRLLQTCEWSRQRHHPPWPLREPCRSGGMAASPMATARSHTATPACSSHVQCSSERSGDEKQQPAAGEGKGTVGGCPGMLCCSWKMSSPNVDQVFCVVYARVFHACPQCCATQSASAHNAALLWATCHAHQTVHQPSVQLGVALALWLYNCCICGCTTCCLCCFCTAAAVDVLLLFLLERRF